MATAMKKLHDDFLSCIICMDLYNDPCTLLCGHTFCRGCLAKFTKTQQDVIKAKSILCPNCRHMTKVPNPGRQVEDWVKQIKPSFLIQGLLDSFASQGGADIGAIENQCCSCLQYDEKTQASSHCRDCDITLCHKCVKSHLAIQHHVISNLTGNVKVKRKRTVTCKSHNIIIEFCCHDCHKAVCPKCCILDHRRCDNVVTIESMVPEMKSVIRETKAAMMKQIKQRHLNLLNSRSKIEQNETQKAKVLSEIRKESQRAISIVKQKEKELVEKVEDCTEKQNRKLKASLEKGEIDIQMYQQHCEFIDQALTAESEMDMYEMYQMCQSGAVGLAAQSDREQTHGSTGFVVTFDKRFDEKKMRRYLQLGTITHLKEKSDPNCTPTLMDTIDIRTKIDKATPDPTDVTVVDVDGIETVVVTDYLNHSLKSIYIKDGRTCHSSLALGRRPWSVTRLFHSQVTVLFHSYNLIVIVKVTPDLFLLSKIVTQKKYRCLTALTESTLVVGSYDPPSLDIIDLAGRVHRSIIPRENLIQGPQFLSTTNKGSIIVSDNMAKSVYCLTPEGEVVFHYTPTKHTELRGITSSTTGDILVAEYHQSKVLQLSSTGRLVRELLTSQDDIDRPYGIFLHKHKLYVAQNCQPLRVFKVNRETLSL